MYKILIVDDENLVRVAFRTMVDYEKYGFCVCGTASDGEEALSLCAAHHPDLIVTDIKMPRMDGITLIERLKENGFPGKVVLISNYDDFELVRQGMVLGAQDYLLKLTITTEEYAAMLLRMKQLLDETHRRLQENEQAQTAVTRLAEREREAFWQNALQEKSAVTLADIPAELFQNGPVSLFLVQVMQYGQVMKVSSQKDMELLSYALLNISVELLGPDSISHGIVKNGQYFIVTHSASCEFMAQKLCAALSQYMNLVTVVAFQPQMADTGALLAALAQMERLQNHFFYVEKPCAVRLDELPPCGEWEVNIPAFSADLCGLLRASNAEGACGRVTDELRLCAQNHVDREELLHKWSAVLLRLAERLEGFLQPGGSLPTGQSLSGTETACALREDIFAFLQKLARALLPESQLGACTVSREVERILQYIHSRLDQKITLAELARHVNFNETYLCTIFRSQTGSSIVSYINRMKMEQAAQQLREGELLLKSISAGLGFSDQFYFNKMFRKYYGVSPSEYRKSCQDTTKNQ